MSMIIQDHVGTAAVRSPRPPRAELIARVRALLPELPPESPRFQAALLYLASRWTPNIDRLAAFAACDREFVARRARRWADHELWTADASAGDGLDRDRLLHAVEVGEGQLPRPVATSWQEEEPAPGEAGQEWATTSAPHASEAGPGAGSPGELRGGLPAPEIVATDVVPGDDPDELLDALWSRLGLPAASATPERRAA